MPSYLRNILFWSLIASVYYLAAYWGLALAFEQDNTSPVWPPSGIAIAALLHFGMRAWPGVFLGAFLINLTTGLSILAASSVATGNTLEAVVASYLIISLVQAYPFSQVSHVVKFFIIILLSAMISATIGVISISLGGAADWSMFSGLWLTWWLGDAFGALLVTPLLLSWLRSYQGQFSKSSMLEAILLLVSALFCVAVVFSGEFFTNKSAYPMSFIFLPLVIWAAYRFCQQGVTLLIALVSFLAVYGTLKGYGPFVLATEFESFLLLQGFIGFMAVTGLVLAAGRDEMTQMNNQLGDTRQQLEARVIKRTEDLQEANLKLEQEVSHRTHTAEYLKSLLSATVLSSDEQFYYRCVKDLAAVYKTRYAFVGLFADENKTSIRTVALWDGERFVDRFSYDLVGTPCKDVLDAGEHLVAEAAAEKYPDDLILGEMGIESYFGAAMVSPFNEQIGIVAVMDDKPLQVQPWARPMLGIYTNRMALEYDRWLAEDELKLAASVFNESVQAILITDHEGTILRVNPAFSRITGYSTEEIIGANPRVLKSNHHSEEFYKSFWQELVEQGSWQGEIWDRHKNGRVFPVWQSITAVHDDNGHAIQYISIFSDITEKKLSEERIFRLAHFDVLTDLPNRVTFQNHLEQAILHADRQQSRLALLFLDLDHFKLINDTSGHPAGDALLKQVANRLQSLLRGDDIVARLGGDEFTILLPGMQEAQGVTQVAEKILTAMKQPFIIGDDDVVVSISIGISTYPDDGMDASTLLKNADAAMYQAKAHGRNNFQFFTEEMNARAQQRLSMENDMRRALERGEFLLHYQPQLSIESGEIVGVEALVRWQHPEQGMISPATFIPVAEDCGLIVPLGEWIMHEACRQHQQWLTSDIPLMRMAVNLSARQFVRDDLINMVRSVVSQTGINPEYLELELTEGIIMENVEQTINTLHQLRDMGVYISIDDFGTGYSSMAYLKRFPIDKLKIDQSFVRDLADDPDDAAIVSATIAMAHNLKLTVIAEGVETQQQLKFLQASGCEEMQGYYFSRPLPADELAELFKSGKTLSNCV